eukprot:3582282-Prorocentrum_lima.AAC.1
MQRMQARTEHHALVSEVLDAQLRQTPFSSEEFGPRRSGLATGARCAADAGAVDRGRVDSSL